MNEQPSEMSAIALLVFICVIVASVLMGFSLVGVAGAGGW